MRTRGDDAASPDHRASPVALLLIDVVNPMDFPGADALLGPAIAAARRLVLTGLAGDICVLFTANDAYMRGFEVVVPRDCIASERREDNDHALAQMARLLKAEIPRSTELHLPLVLADDREAPRRIGSSALRSFRSFARPLRAQGGGKP
jgi:hypothetical protein